MVTAALLLPHPGAATDHHPAESLLEPDVCALIRVHAEARRLPPAFLARLIWQESRFNRLAVSPKGAQGIAQFMPATAAARALEDPFDIPSALAASAAFLRELEAAFGNLGLAAAAYNAGADRVRRWLAGKAQLPLETQRYVWSITGSSPHEWRQANPEPPTFALDGDRPFEEGCASLVTAGLRPPAVVMEEAATGLPWGVQIAAHHSRDIALAAFQRQQQRFESVLGGQAPTVVRYRAPGRGPARLYAVRIGAETRQAAQALCDELRAINGACVVMKN
jgi:hypothetical protein